ncbi:Zinc finger Ran-binding domain-containing protein [Drosera capensis]
MSWAGDWMCGACQHVNFKKRETCQKCGFPKFGTQADVSAYLFNRTEVLAGDWYCQSMNCGAHNYASRTSCYRCGAMKSDYVSGYAASMVGSGGYGSENQPPGWKTGDWICTRVGCGMHNYASRTECYKCRTPRDFGEKSSSSSS